ncbi:uncharacterized protein LOC134233940 [Saccostrea cucullata]|uniref:uncharacterized protein LOC134233940 n=1 Tax=Saccostrea cuccullata TaxID=36930 RepID=UPI002ED14CE5
MAQTSGCNNSLPHAGVTTALCSCHNISETEKDQDLNVNIRLGFCTNCSQGLHCTYLKKENASETMLNFTLNFQEICSEIFQNQSMGPTVTESVRTSNQPTTLNLTSQELPQSTIPSMTTKSNPPRSWIMANRYCCNSSQVLVSTKDDTWLKHSNTSMVDDSTEVWLDEVLSLGPWVMLKYLRSEEYDFKNMTDSTSEKLRKAYRCTGNCQNENYFQANIYEKDVECSCFNTLPEFQKQAGSIIVGQNINQIITRTNVANDNLTSIEGDICIVAHLNTKVRPITYTLREQRCNNTSGILCQNKQGTQIEYYFSEKDVTFMDGVLYCENKSAVPFTPVTFQSRALENTKYFAKYMASNVQVWTGIFKRNTWIQTFCDFDYSPDYCKIISMNGTVRKVDCGESHTTVCSTGMETTFQSTTSVIPTTEAVTTQFTSEVVTTESTNFNQVSSTDIENITIPAVTITSESSLDLSTVINTTATTGTFIEIKTTELITTTEDPNKKTWSEWQESCCSDSKVLYYEGMETEDDHFNLTSVMKDQNLDAIYVNSRLDVGNWILFVGMSFFSILGRFTTNNTVVSLSDDTDIYECASMCKHCWYFGLKKRSCLNISTISYLDKAMDNEEDIELFTTKGVEVIEDVVPSIGVEVVQIDLNTDVYPVVYTLTVRDSSDSAKALCQTDDSVNFTSTGPMDFETSEEFCNNKSARLGFSFSSFHIYQNRLGTGTYWTSVTRRNHLFNTDCGNSKIGRYCTKVLLSGEMVTTDCTEKLYSICVKEKKTTTSSTTTTTTSTTSSPTTTTTTVPDTTQTSLITIPTRTTPRPQVDYIHEVLYDFDKEEAARQCEDMCGRLWSSDLLDMDMVNVTEILDMNRLNETWTNYQLYVSPWVVSIGLTSNINAFVHNITMTQAELYHCASKCQAFPKFVLLADICYCLLSGASIERYYNLTTAVVYDTLRDFSMDADEFTEADKQCIIAVMNYKIFPITYTLQQAPCDGTYSVICQDIKDQTIRYSYIYPERGTYSEAAGACLNSSMTVFNPFSFNPSLFATLLNLTAAVTVWTAVTREFYWWTRREEFVKNKRPYCQLLGIHGTLSSQPCSSKKSSLCFIERNKENGCSAAK